MELNGKKNNNSLQYLKNVLDTNPGYNFCLNKWVCVYASFNKIRLWLDKENFDGNEKNMWLCLYAKKNMIYLSDKIWLHILVVNKH